MSMESETLVVDTYQGGPSELDTAVDAFIGDISKQFKQENLDAELAALETPATGDAPVGADAAPAGEAAAAATPEPAANPDGKKLPEDRGFERLVEREVALHAREAGLASRESRIADYESRLKELEARQMPADLATKFETNPEEALKHLRVDPEALVRQIIANRMAEKAGGVVPPELRQTIEAAKTNRRIQDLENKLLEQQRTAAASAFVAQVEAGGREYVNKGIGEYAPTVATVAKANPERAYREIMQEISADAHQKMARGSGGDVLSYEEAAKRVEARWSEFKAILSPAPAPAAQTASTPTSAAPVQEAKPTPATTKTPDRPIAPWLRNSASEDEGIKAALAEYKRIENAR